VGKLYLQGGFIIDLISGVPISFLEFFLAPDMSCEELEESGLNKGIVPYLRYFDMLNMWVWVFENAHIECTLTLTAKDLPTIYCLV